MPIAILLSETDVNSVSDKPLSLIAKCLEKMHFCINYSNRKQCSI